MTDLKSHLPDWKDHSTVQSGETLDIQRQRLVIGRRNQKRSNTVYIQKVETLPNQLSDNLQAVNSNSIFQNCLLQSQLIQPHKFRKLFLDLGNISLKILPTKKQQKDIAVQCIQEERQYFEYLKYKRRKDQFQRQLENLFTEISIVKNDRAIFQSRTLKLKNVQNQQPANQREQRIFKLRNQISKHQQKVKSSILEKYTSFDRYLTDLTKLSLFLQNDSEKFVESFSAHFKPTKDCPQQNQVDYLEKTFQKMQNYIRCFLRQNIKKIEILIQKNKPFNDDMVELIQQFKEYKNSVEEQRKLLKNCFEHIKKVPQLCYSLCGNQLSHMETKSQLRNENNEFQMPKCIDCFNWEWKLRLIIEKNIFMESIFKVTQQLLR